MLTHDHQDMGIEEQGSGIIFFSTIKSLNGKSECNVQLDGMPAKHKKHHTKRRNVLSIADLDEEEQEHDHVAEECENIENKKSNTQLKSQ